MSGVEIKEEPSDEVRVNEDSTLDTSQGMYILSHAYASGVGSPAITPQRSEVISV